MQPRATATTFSTNGASTSARPLRVLLVGEDAAYARLLRRTLREVERTRFEIAVANTTAEACSRLTTAEWDCVLLDLAVSEAAGLESLVRVQAARPGIAVVVLSSQDREQLALEALHRGAQDYLPKGRLEPQLVARAIRYAIERKSTEQELSRLALHDSLTGLPNRVLFIDRLERALARADRRPRSLAVLFVDLDRFKAVNDTFGHQAGDRVLSEIASRLRSTIRPSDTVARLGGDEFALLCEDLPGPDAPVQVAERICSRLERPFRFGEDEVFVRASVGIALAEGPAAAMDLLRDADDAMYTAKERGCGWHACANGLAERRASSRRGLENDLHRAVERGELRVFYQPQVSFRTGAVAGVEALVRWRHPRRGLIEPDYFIPLAEQTGLIVPVGAWVLEEACRQVRRWQAGGPELDLTMSVNVSPRQLADPGFIGTVGDALASSAIDPSQLCLEITEEAVVDDVEGVTETLKVLKTLGVNLAMDDFGRGRSSLSFLDRFPIDLLKIDRTFVERLRADRGSRRIVAAVIGLAHALGLVAVAEGVEGLEDHAELESLGCDFAQGYLFCEARPADALAPLLAGNVPVAA